MSAAGLIDVGALNRFDIRWTDHGREPQCEPDPAYPDGVDLDATAGAPGCSTDLPYPAKRCGLYHVACRVCGSNAIITTAGRPDDPRSVKLACRKPESFK